MQARDAEARAVTVLDEIVLAAARERGVILDLPVVRVLLADGIEAGAALSGVSSRTLRRHYVARGVPVAQLLKTIRERSYPELIRARVPDTEIARVLGFARPSTLNRFLRHTFRRRVRDLKKVLRPRPSLPSAQTNQEEGLASLAG